MFLSKVWVLSATIYFDLKHEHSKNSISSKNNITYFIKILLKIQWQRVYQHEHSDQH